MPFHGEKNLSYLFLPAALEKSSPSQMVRLLWNAIKKWARDWF